MDYINFYKPIFNKWIMGEFDEQTPYDLNNSGFVGYYRKKSTEELLRELEYEPKNYNLGFQAKLFRSNSNNTNN